VPVEKEQIRSKILQTLGELDRVLDVGCGNCDMVRFLARELAQEAVGIDLRADLVHEHLHSERDGSERTARCQKADAQHMDEFADGHFDAVVRRVLKEGGTLFIADFTRGETRWDERYFTPAEARAMLDEAGFARISVRKVPGEHFMFAVASK